MIRLLKKTALVAASALSFAQAVDAQTVNYATLKNADEKTREKYLDTIKDSVVAKSTPYFAEASPFTARTKKERLAKMKKEMKMSFNEVDSCLQIDMIEQTVKTDGEACMQTVTGNDYNKNGIVGDAPNEIGRKQLIISSFAVETDVASRQSSRGHLLNRVTINYEVNKESGNADLFVATQSSDDVDAKGRSIEHKGRVQEATAATYTNVVVGMFMEANKNVVMAAQTKLGKLMEMADIQAIQMPSTVAATPPTP